MENIQENFIEEGIKMITYKSRWKDRGLRDFSGVNVLYEVVRYYGGYLWYCENISQDVTAYPEFYYDNKDRMQWKFINKANKNAREYFSKIGISNTKMRRMLITGAGKTVKSYEWIFEYVDYILKQSTENDFIRDQVFHIIQEGCDYCNNQAGIEEWKVMCSKRLLGFQYELLNNVSGRKTRASESALRNMNEIENSVFISKIMKRCPVVMKK